jgi:hypothetical protein
VGVDLYWLPLGAGGHFVRLNGRVFEAVVAQLERRPAKALYHSALIVSLPEGEFVIEQAPVRDGDGALRGVVAEGAIGSRRAGSLRLFRYEIRRWRDGVIPDVDEAVDSPQRLTDDPRLARRVLELVPHVPTPVWGRDELGTGEMWNSNSVISWLLSRGGLDVDAVQPPAGGRAPGWHAGLVVALAAPKPEAADLAPEQGGPAAVPVALGLEHVDEAGKGKAIVELEPAHVERHAQRPDERPAAVALDPLAHARQGHDLPLAVEIGHGD